MKNREDTKSHGEEYTEGAKDETGKKSAERIWQQIPNSSSCKHHYHYVCVTIAG